MIPLTTIQQVARDTTYLQVGRARKGVFCTSENHPRSGGIQSGILFRMDLEAIAREVTLSIDVPALQKNPTAATLVKCLIEENEVGIDALSGAVISTNAFRNAMNRKYVGEISFPIKYTFHFSL